MEKTDINLCQMYSKFHKHWLMSDATPGCFNHEQIQCVFEVAFGCTDFYLLHRSAHTATKALQELLYVGCETGERDWLKVGVDAIDLFIVC